MPDTPYEMRGWLYSTHLTQRCPSFRKCPLCTQCQNFDRHNAICVMCESRKPYKQDPRYTCTCPDEKKSMLIKLQEVFKKPLFDGQSLSIPDLSLNIAEDATYKELGTQLEKEFGEVGVKSAQISTQNEGTITYDPNTRGIVV